MAIWTSTFASTTSSWATVAGAGVAEALAAIDRLLTRKRRPLDGAPLP